MSVRVDPSLKKELQEFGIQEWNECYHCGNCTAICPLTEEGALFPRKGIRQIQMGLKDSLIKNVDPWLCYYCGECSETCPRGANPGELMMTLRRYLTSIYDWTGISKKFYTSKFWEFSAISFFAVFVVFLFAMFLPPSDRMASDPMSFVNDQGGVMINSMVDGMGSAEFVDLIEYGDWTMAVIVAFLLISNILNMFFKIVISDKSIKIPFIIYITNFWSLIWNFVTQAKFSKCEGKTYWGGHFLLMSGYTIMFTVIVVFLKWFQTEEIVEWYHPQRLLGYYATFGILSFLIYSFIGRLRRGEVKFEYSHPSDWLFIVMLFLTTVTGIVLHFLRINGMVEATYYAYVIHLAVLVPMIMVEVPFSKWSHLAYRPFAAYFRDLKKVALIKQNNS